MQPHEQSIIITGTNETDSSLDELIREQLDSEFIDAHDLTIGVDTWTADEYGGAPDDLQPCPYCDGTTLSIIEAEENIYEVTVGGDIVFAEHGNIGNHPLNVYCAECHEYLLRTPADRILQYD